MTHLESLRANTVDTRAAYVAISRAKTFATIYTDDRLALVEAIEGRDGAKVGAIDETLTRGKVATTRPTPQTQRERQVVVPKPFHPPR